MVSDGTRVHLSSEQLFEIDTFEWGSLRPESTGAGTNLLSRGHLLLSLSTLRHPFKAASLLASVGVHMVFIRWVDMTFICFA